MSRNKGKGRGKKEEEVEEEKSSEEETEEQRLEREHKRLLEHRKMREQKAKELAERKAKEAEEAAARAAQRGETPEDQEEEPKEDKNTKGKKGQKKQDEQQQEEEKEEEGEGEEDDEDSIGARILKGELIYCPTCGLPPEFCEWGPDFNKCKPWILKNCPQLYPKLAEEAAKKNAAAGGGEKQGDGEKKKQKRGGKGQPKPAKEAPEEAEDDDSKKVTISIAKRGNHKHNTTVHNLEAFGVPLKTASQIFRKKFATGSNPVSNGAITIQGDIVDDLIELICDQDWGITEDDIVTLEEGKKIQTRKKNSRPRGKKGGRSGAFPNPSSNLNA